MLASRYPARSYAITQACELVAFAAANLDLATALVPANANPMRVGIFLPNWIGDVIMATPTVRALRRQLGTDDRLIGIMRPYVADVLEGLNFLDETICYDKQEGRFPFA